MNLEDLYRLLRSSHVQAQGIVDSLTEPLLVIDQTQSVINANRAFFETFMVERDATIGSNLFALGNGQWNIPELRRLIGEVIPKAKAVVGYEVDADFPSIGRRTMLVNARRMSHPDNNSTNLVLVFDDVTERRRADAERDVFLAETQHRMKNMLGMVRAIASQTEVTGRTAQEFRDAFLGRMEAAIRAQTIPMGPTGHADLQDLVRAAFEAPGADRLHVDHSPVVELEPRQVMPVSLILHELVTNALKYGALSTASGKVRLIWDVRASPEGKVLHFDWSEEAGPPVRAPKRQGFGTRLIQFSSQSLGGQAEMQYPPEGFRTRIVFPLQ